MGLRDSRRRRRPTGLAAALALVACGGGGGNDRCTNGSFVANLTDGGGAAIDSYAGHACYFHDAGTGEWALGLVDTNQIDSVVVGRESGGRPPGGSTTIPVVAAGATDLGLRARLTFVNDLFVCGTGEDGFLEVTNSTPSNVDGALSVGLLCARSNGQTTFVRLDATFQAVKGPVKPIP